MRTTMRDSTAPRKRRSLLRALAETPVLAHRSATFAAIPPTARVTLGTVVRRDPVYAPHASLLARIGAAASGECKPPRRNVLIATKVDHPPHDGVDPLLGVRPLRPQRSATNLLHQVLRGLWSVGDIPVAEVPEAGPQQRADGESCGAEVRPARSSAPLESQVPAPEEVVEVAEPPQAEAQRPQTCERPCGPVSPGARQLAAKAGKLPNVDPRCRGEHKFEGEYTPFSVEAPSERGKPGQSCPCECVCTPIKRMYRVAWFEEPRPFQPFFFHPVYIPELDGGSGWLDFFSAASGEVVYGDASIGFASADDRTGPVARHRSGASPALDALRGGQSQGLGVASGLDLDLGVMRPALTLTALATSGIPAALALVPPDLPAGEPSFIVALRAGQLSPDQS